MRKGMIVAGIIIAGIIIAGITIDKKPEEAIKEAYISNEPPRVQYIEFPPMEVKAEVTILDFTDEPPMIIVVKPDTKVVK